MCSADEATGLTEEEFDPYENCVRPVKRTCWDAAFRTEEQQATAESDEEKTMDMTGLTEQEAEAWKELFRYGDTPEGVAQAVAEWEASTVPPPPPTYIEALGALAALNPRYTERHLLLNFGDTHAQVSHFLAVIELEPFYSEVLLAHWVGRRQDVELLGSTLNPFLEPEAPEIQKPVNQGTKRPAPRLRRQSRIPSTATGRESATERRKLDYKDTVYYVIEETRNLTAALGLRPFPHTRVDAPVSEVAETYGYTITSKEGGGLRALRSLRTQWNRIRRFMDAAQDEGHVSVPFACQFIDLTKLTGMANTFKWAGVALGLPIFLEFAEEPAIKLRQPRRGWAADAPPHVPKKAPWISDGFVNYLAARAVRAERRAERVRAFFFYLLAVGGVRYQDAQHTVQIEIVNAEIRFTATRFKATKGDQVEVFALPLEGPNGLNFLAVARELCAQMGEGFLLGHPLEPQEVGSPPLTPPRGCSYQAGVTLIRAFAASYIRALSPKHEDRQPHRDFSRITMHSLRSWLATLARQVEVPLEEINELLHWSNTTMARCYTKNFEAIEVRQRARIVALLSGPWRSAGPGDRLADDAPKWDATRRTAQF